MPNIETLIPGLRDQSIPDDNRLKVLFAVPSYHRTPCLEFLMSALVTRTICDRAGVADIWRCLGGDPYVHKARNTLASDFIHAHPDFDKFVFLDDDIGWEAAPLLKALQRPEDIIAGVYPHKEEPNDKALLALKKWYDETPDLPIGEFRERWENSINLYTKQSFPVEVLFDADTGDLIYNDCGYVAASLVPTGFLVISQRALRAAAFDSGEYPAHVKDVAKSNSWDMFRTGFVPLEESGKTGKWWGEDFFFSLMMRNLGFDIWVDPDIEFTHFGTKTYRARFADELERQKEHHKRNILEMKRKAAAD